MSKVLKIAATVAAVAALAIVTGGAAVGLPLSLATTITGTAISAGALLTAAHAVSGRASALIGEALA